MKTARERFESRVHKTIGAFGGCWLWLWLGGLLNSGYGIFRMGGRKALQTGAHRASWLIYRGEIPGDKQVLHTCDNRPCVNPEHLYLGSHADNMRDMEVRGRRKRGQQHGCAKLTQEQVEKIRVLESSGKSQRLIAAEIGISKRTVWGILRGKSWTHETR